MKSKEEQPELTLAESIKVMLFLTGVIFMIYLLIQSHFYQEHPIWTTIILLITGGYMERKCIEREGEYWKSESSRKYLK